MVKLSPNAENIVDMALSCEEAGADAISLINTFKGMAIDIKKEKLYLIIYMQDYQDQLVKPIALRMVHEVCKACKVPVIGLGGIY